jgi:hypothetical protein
MIVRRCHVYSQRIITFGAGRLRPAMHPFCVVVILGMRCLSLGLCGKGPHSQLCVTVMAPEISIRVHKTPQRVIILAVNMHSPTQLLCLPKKLYKRALYQL